jgi:hypothetical protein
MALGFDEELKLNGLKFATKRGRLGRNYRSNIETVMMKTMRLMLIFVLVVVGLNFTSQAQRRAKQDSPERLVSDLYRQHKQRSPFFQTRSRVLLDKYFTRELADLIWRDARSSGDEVGALDGDPLFNAQDMKITNFQIQRATMMSGSASVPVTFENFGEKHQIIFRVVQQRRVWKIADIAYDDGLSLVKILQGDGGTAEKSQPIKIYLVAVGDDGKRGRKIGCGDSLVPVDRSIKKTAAPLAAAIRELLITPQHTEGNPPLENFWKGRNLQVRSVAIVNRTAIIRLTGEVFVAGVCDEPRIEGQIEETARQFPTVKKVSVFIGNRTLADAIR